MDVSINRIKKMKIRAEGSFVVGGNRAGPSRSRRGETAFKKGSKKVKNLEQRDKRSIMDK